MASPAQVANDMAARANFWWGRDKKVAAACRDAARVIRGYLGGPPPDGPTVSELLARIYDVDALGSVDTVHSLSRAANTIRDLRKEIVHATR